MHASTLSPSPHPPPAFADAVFACFGFGSGSTHELSLVQVRARRAPGRKALRDSSHATFQTPHVCLCACRQAERLERLQSRVGVSFRPDDDSHKEQLKQLWMHAFPQLPCTTLKTAQWKEMGWQGEDPATDFRGSGHLGLECLLYLAEEHPDTFARLMNKQEGQRSDWEYPFAVAGLNLTFMLEEVVGLRKSQMQPQQPAASSSGSPPLATQTPAGRGFLKVSREWRKGLSTRMQG
jgi:hypothetical protein